MGKILIIAGAGLVIIGLVLHFAPRLPWPAKLPGDIWIDRGNFKVFIPVTTSIILSLVISLILYLVNKSK